MLLRNFQDFVSIETFTKIALEKLGRNFKLIPRKFQKTYKGIKEIFWNFGKILKNFRQRKMQENFTENFPEK